MNRIITILCAIAIVVPAAVVLAQPVSNFTQTIITESQSVDIVDDQGSVVNRPIISLPTPTSNEPQKIFALLTSPQQKLRIINPSAKTPWTVSIAATDGPNALWSDGVNSYDYNDKVSGQDGPDGDDKGGALSINPSASSIINVLNADVCTSNDLSLGTNHFFADTDQSLSSITLVNGMAESASNCQWDIVGVELQQTVPGSQVPGAYHLNFTVTII